MRGRRCGPLWLVAPFLRFWGCGVPAPLGGGCWFRRRWAATAGPSVVEQRSLVPACCVRFDLGPLDLPPCRAKKGRIEARSPTNFRGQIPQVKSDTTREGPALLLDDGWAPNSTAALSSCWSHLRGRACSLFTSAGTCGRFYLGFLALNSVGRQALHLPFWPD